MADFGQMAIDGSAKARSAALVQGPEVGDGGGDAEGGADGVEVSPCFDHRPGGRVCIVFWDRLEFVVRGHHADQRVGPVGDDQHGANEPAPVACQPRRDQAQCA